MKNGTTDISKCFQVLELHREASIHEVRAAYRDLVNVWHPDRFSGHVRLKQKSEAKLKEINLAYETLEAHFSSAGGKGPPSRSADTETTTEPLTAEAVAEAGTRLILTAWASASAALRRFIDQTRHSPSVRPPESKRKKERSTPSD